jgi:hypothetical protein
MMLAEITNFHAKYVIKKICSLKNCGKTDELYERGITAQNECLRHQKKSGKLHEF